MDFPWQCLIPAEIAYKFPLENMIILYEHEIIVSSGNIKVSQLCSIRFYHEKMQDVYLIDVLPE